MVCRLPRWSDPHACSSSVQTVLSCCCPGVMSAAKGLPRPSHTRCTFVEKPPRERPKASQSPLLRSRCDSGGSHTCGGVGKPSIEIHQPLCTKSDLEPLQDTVEGAIVRPDTAPVVCALPGTETLRKSPPRSTASQNPEDRVEHLPWVALLASDGLRGRKRSRISCHSWSSCRPAIGAA